MQALKDLDRRIVELKRRKEQLRLRAADTLYRRLEGLLKEDFSSEMVVGLIADTWNKSSALNREHWQEQGALFFQGIALQKDGTTASHHLSSTIPTTRPATDQAS